MSSTSVMYQTIPPPRIEQRCESDLPQVKRFADSLVLSPDQNQEGVAIYGRDVISAILGGEPVTLPQVEDRLQVTPHASYVRAVSAALEACVRMGALRRDASNIGSLPKYSCCLEKEDLGLLTPWSSRLTAEQDTFLESPMLPEGIFQGGHTVHGYLLLRAQGMRQSNFLEEFCRAEAFLGRTPPVQFLEQIETAAEEMGLLTTNPSEPGKIFLHPEIFPSANF